MIQIKEITKSYKDGQNKKLVIDNLNLNICNIGLYTFLGPSGSGKTTILNLISLLDYPDKGDILINDKSILKYTQKEINEYTDKRIPLVINVSIYPDKNVNVELPIDVIAGENSAYMLQSAYSQLEKLEKMPQGTMVSIAGYGQMTKEQAMNLQYKAIQQAMLNTMTYYDQEASKEPR